MAAAYGLYSHIQSNRTRSILLLAGLFALVYVLVYAGALLGEAVGFGGSLPAILDAAGRDFAMSAPWATLGAAAWIGIAYWFHQTLIDVVTGGRAVTRADAPKLYNLLENLCISRGITMPKLKIADSHALNAFASGMSEKQYSITVTSALLDRLSDQEMEAVLGHELTHIRNGDVRLLVIAVVITGVISFFGELIFRTLTNGVRLGMPRRNDREQRGGGGGSGPAMIIAFALIAMSWALSVLIRFALSRSREFLADAGSVELTKNPDAMISALRKIEGRGELANVPSAVMEMCVDNPREGFSDLFATHPSISARIAALIKFAGGHDPGPQALDGTGPLNPWANDSPKEPDEPAEEGPPGPWSRSS